MPIVGLKYPIIMMTLISSA
ncbi:hypothetical protein [Paenibacillus lupini]